MRRASQEEDRNSCYIKVFKEHRKTNSFIQLYYFTILAYCHDIFKIEEQHEEKREEERMGRGEGAATITVKTVHLVSCLSAFCDVLDILVEIHISFGEASESDSFVINKVS